MLPSAREAPPEILFQAADLHRAGEWLETDLVEAPDGATRVGLLVDLTATGAFPAVEVRGSDAFGTPGDWTAVQVTWYEHPYAVARADVGGIVYAAQLRVPADQAASLAHIALSAVIPETHPMADAPLATQTAPLSVDSVALPRSAWNARKSKCSSWDPNKARIAIHHTVTPPTSGGSYEARLRQIQAYHMDTRGWCDVGYHYLVTTDGRVWEGRPSKHRGAHVGGHNSKNAGISFVGCFHSSGCASLGEMKPPAVMLESAAQLVSALSQEHGFAIGPSTVKGHRDHPSQWTSCPGDHLHAKLAELRQLAESGGAPPSTEEGPAEPDPVQPSTGEATGRVLGVVWDVTTASGPGDAAALWLSEGFVVAPGAQQQLSPGSEIWLLNLPPGDHVITAQSPGYAPAQRVVTVAAGMDTWASIGVSPESPPQWVETGAVQGVVWDATKTPSPASWGNVRLDHATVFCSCGVSTQARAGDAWWRLDVPPGTHTLTAVAQGYAPRSKVVEVGSGASTLWASIGMAPW